MQPSSSDALPLRRILVALDTGAGDALLLRHATALAALHGAELVLFHVSDGWAARLQNTLHIEDSEEMAEDRAYLEARAAELAQAGRAVTTRIAQGDPAEQIVKAAVESGADLIAMASHHHKGLADVVLGSTIDKVRHRTRLPLWITPPAA